ncbi:molybdate-binding periplasmic protein precursor [Clostridium homopropionicum DSM 5847]|uniref:Molybdate-binding periplasmic protein n=1 Tax=Clostridium homopropionicum DSM 5847 TaxID=1121318 RepID=A0A0L6Z717_9CLOT|nr:molybdate ABC transporter substrate-binding protein [Clostridium homopropionicum]KOA18623.1 molybdate-binding periplasmic protein precursor [Clostridium homopropionicum DSM 5847]SFG50433.1 molybdate transport system substrate-binding protein [Clostridium homopropionicum]
MKKLFKNCAILLSLFLVVVFTACGKTEAVKPSTSEKSASDTKSEAAVNLTISAAASLKDALTEIQELYKKEKSNVTINYNFGSSGALQTQIEQGAPSDVFLSAGKKQVDALKTKGLIIEDTYKNLLENEVVLVVSKDSKDNINFENLAEAKVKKIGLGEPESVPAGQYGKEVLAFLKIFDKISSKSVYAKDVREVLAWVETGNVDAGIVYKTDAKVSDKVKVAAEAPKGSHKDIVYPGAVIKASKNIEASKEFLKFLSGEEATKIFEKYGFDIAK